MSLTLTSDWLILSSCSLLNNVRRNWVRLDARCKQYLKKYLEGQHSRQETKFFSNYEALKIFERQASNHPLQLVRGS